MSDPRPGSRRQPWLKRPRQPLYDGTPHLFFLFYVLPVAAFIGGVSGLASAHPHLSDAAAVVGSLAVMALSAAYFQRPVVAGRRPWWVGGGDRPPTRLFAVLEPASAEEVPWKGELVPLTPEEVEQTRFSTVRFKEGYDEVEVDAFLDRVAQELRRLNARIAELERQAAS